YAPRERVRRPHSARADGIRAAALSRTAAAQYWRAFRHDRRGGQKLPLPRHAENARGHGRVHMKCDEAGRMIPLYYYGDLTPEQEEEMDEHLHSCAECTRELERNRALAAALDRRQVDATPAFLEDCRRDLLVSLYRGETPTPQRQHSQASPWRLFLDALSSSIGSLSRWRQPIAGLALLAARVFVGGFGFAFAA